MFGTGIIEGLVTAGILSLSKGMTAIRLHAFALTHGNREVRISFSTLLRVRNGQNYLLIRNNRRREQFGPIGGVNKYYDSAIRFLDSVCFRPQVVAKEMEYDLRGFLPSKHLPKLVDWYLQKQDCENSDTSLRREIKEELSEMGISSIQVPDDMDFQAVRIIWEGPRQVPGLGYNQFRLFHIFDIRPNSNSSKTFLEDLWCAGGDSQNLLIVTPQEILQGRSSNSTLIGSLSEYLFHSRLSRPDGPAFVTPIK